MISIDVSMLEALSTKPRLDDRGYALMWTDPHISKQMLAAHLSPQLDAASRPHHVIDNTVKWLHKMCNMPSSAQVLDLGCGPGLYSSRFARLGWQVTGIDISSGSVVYAKDMANRQDLPIEYICDSYLNMDYENVYDAIFMVYCDFGALMSCHQQRLLAKVYKALKPGGYFIVDVFTERHLAKEMAAGREKEWEVSESGFWRPRPYVAFSQRFLYPHEQVVLYQHLICDEKGLTTYRILKYGFSRIRFIRLLEKYNLSAIHVRGDLWGTPYTDEAEMLGVIAQKIRRTRAPYSKMLIR